MKNYLINQIFFSWQISSYISLLLEWHDVKKIRSVSKKIKKSFRIWIKDWDYQAFLNDLCVGMYVDASDLDNRWFKSIY